MAGGKSFRTSDDAQFDREVGERIRMVRQRLEMNQADLAKALGISGQQVQKYEAGANRIPTSRLRMIAGSLNVPMALLLGEAGDVVGVPTLATARLLADYERCSPARRRVIALMARTLAREV